MSSADAACALRSRSGNSAVCGYSERASMVVTRFKCGWYRPHQVRWTEPHLKTRWNGPRRYRDFISVLFQKSAEACKTGIGDATRLRRLALRRVRRENRVFMKFL